MPCFSCGADAFESSGAMSVCTRCGTVAEDNAIVSEIQFGETSGGAAVVQGSYIGADQTRARAPAGYRQKGGGESREQTILNGKRRIQALSTALRLNERLADAGQRYFNLAVNVNFTQGRRTQYVVAACLYSACRMERTSHMLIDFSDLLEINVFVLGATYLKLAQALSLQMPVIDPSLFISRFAALLEFGEETQKVASDAVRLVSRMQRDWMDSGRRPSGICGACLLLAARMNNFRRSVAEVIQVVKIADTTLRKRLDEFRDTPSGALTVSDFRTIWLDETADPPAFTKSQKKEQLEREKAEAKARRKEAGLDSDDEEDDEGDDDAAFNELAKVKVAVADEADAIDDPMEDDDEPSLIPIPSTETKSAKALGKRKARDEDVDADGEPADEEEDDFPTRPNPVLDEMMASEIGQMLNSGPGKALTAELDLSEKRRMESSTALTNVRLNESNSLDDLDEDELDHFILGPREVEIKTRVWMEANVKYLQMLADKQTGPDGELKPQQAPRYRKRSKPKDSTTAQGANAADAAKQMLQKKRFSKKINYAAIDELFKETGSKPGTPRESLHGDEDEDEDEEGDEEPEQIFGKASGNIKSKAGQPIHVPRPTFGGSRAGTPARASLPPQTAQSHAEEEEEEEDDDEEEEEDRARDEDDGEGWRHLQTQHDDDAEQYGYDEV